MDMSLLLQYKDKAQKTSTASIIKSLGLFFYSVNCLQAQNEINYSTLVLDSLVYLTSASLCSNGLITAA